MQSCFSWEVIINDTTIISRASEIEEENLIPYWDALILSAAFEANVETFLTEDLNHGQAIEGILVKNPFKDDGS